MSKYAVGPHRSVTDAERRCCTVKMAAAAAAAALPGGDLDSGVTHQSPSVDKLRRARTQTDPIHQMATQDGFNPLNGNAGRIQSTKWQRWMDSWNVDEDGSGVKMIGSRRIDPHQKR